MSDRETTHDGRCPDCRSHTITRPVGVCYWRKQRGEPIHKWHDAQKHPINGELHAVVVQHRAKIRRMVKEFREAVANYMQSEGCDCCCNTDAHDEHKAVLAKMLGVPKYPDSSGHDFSRFRTPK